MASWGIAEWYGRDIRIMSAAERHAAAEVALESSLSGVANVDVPECPFLATINPGSTCNKVGGICSIRPYEGVDPVVLPDVQPAAVCPHRFLEVTGGESIFSFIAQRLFNVESGAKVIKEVPFLFKVGADGEIRSAKAGRIDWVVIPFPPEEGDNSSLDWVAVETQAVYFSGANMWGDVKAYLRDPSRLHPPAAHRRPDYRSSGVKRLAPQLSAKSPVMRRWGHKVVVVVDVAFFSELAPLREIVNDFDNSEVVWIVMRYSENLNLVVDNVIFAELSDSVQALQATKAMNRGEFEQELKTQLWKSNSRKVHLA